MSMSSRLLALLCLAGVLGWTEPLTIMQASAGTKLGVSVNFETRLEPAAEDVKGVDLSGGVMVRAEVIHRWMVSPSHKQYFGYDVRLESTGSPNEYLLSVLPLTMRRDEIRLKDPAKWTELALPRHPLLQTIRFGERLAMDLMVNPVSGQKVVDYVTIGNRIRDPRRLTAEGPARDFRAEDAVLQLRNPRVVINGQLLERPKGSSLTASGQVVFIYLRDHGRLLFSLVPGIMLKTAVPAFQKAGEIRGSTMTFEAGGNHYEVNCEGLIAPGVDAYTLYVSHDLSYQPPRFEYPLEEEVNFWVGSSGVE